MKKNLPEDLIDKIKVATRQGTPFTLSNEQCWYVMGCLNIIQVIMPKKIGDTVKVTVDGKDYYLSFDEDTE